MKVQELSDEQLSLWIAEFFRRTNPRAWHENPDFVNDPAMTVMLLEKLGATGDIQIIGMGEHWRLRHFGPAPEMIERIVDADPLGRAVAEAFALASGYSE